MLPGLLRVNNTVLKAVPLGEFRAIEHLRDTASPGPGTTALVFD